MDPQGEGAAVCGVGCGTCVCEPRAYLTVVTLHMVVSVHGHHTNGCLTALEEKAEFTFFLDLEHYGLSVKTHLSTTCHSQLRWQVSKSEYTCGLASSPTGV